MTDLLPLTSNPSDSPVILIDKSQRFLDLQECADQRLSAARGLMHSLACMNIGLAAAKDLTNVAEAVCLLLEDASDLYKAAGEAAKREGCKHA